jgi:hypothetical protein
MHLIWFHRVLIGTAIAFFAAYAAWEVAAYQRHGTTTSLLLGAVSFCAAVLLFLYLRRLRRFLNLPPGR